MQLTEKIKLAIIKGVFERGIFDAKRLMEIDSKKGEFTISGIRSIIVGTLDFAVLHEAAEKLAGNAGPAILRAQGEKVGRIEARKAWRKNMKRFNLSFDVRTVISTLPAIYAAVGWGKIITTGINMKTGEGTLIIRNCFEADAILELRGEKGRPQCYFVTGYLKGLFGGITGKKFQVTETKCKAAGAEYCEFKITTGRESV